jgi:hypothetical protein
MKPQFRFAAICLALALLTAVQPLWAAKITEIVVKKAEGVTQVFVNGDDILNATDYVLEKPYRLVLDVKGATLAFGNKTFAINRGGISTISTTQFDREGGIARIVVEMSTKPSYLMMNEENDLIVALTTKDTSPFAEWKATAAGTEVAAATPSAPAPAAPSAPAPVVEEQPATPSAPATAAPSKPAPVEIGRAHV